MIRKKMKLDKPKIKHGLTRHNLRFFDLEKLKQGSVVYFFINQFDIFEG